MSRLDNIDWSFKQCYADCYLYPNGVTPVKQEGLVKVILSGEEKYPTNVVFSTKDKIPSLPLLLVGEQWHIGWDCPTVWALDKDKNLWKNNAHGNCLSLVKEENKKDVALGIDSDKLLELLDIKRPETYTQKLEKRIKELEKEKDIRDIALGQIRERVSAILENWMRPPGGQQAGVPDKSISPTTCREFLRILNIEDGPAWTYEEFMKLQNEIDELKKENDYLIKKIGE